MAVAGSRLRNSTGRPELPLTEAFRPTLKLAYCQLQICSSVDWLRCVASLWQLTYCNNINNIVAQSVHNHIQQDHKYISVQYMHAYRPILILLARLTLPKLTCIKGQRNTTWIIEYMNDVTKQWNWLTLHNGQCVTQTPIFLAQILQILKKL